MNYHLEVLIALRSVDCFCHLYAFIIMVCFVCIDSHTEYVYLSRFITAWEMFLDRWAF